MVRIGFDVGGTSIKAGILDEDMNLITKKIAPFPKKLGYHNIIKAMDETAEAMLTEIHLDKSRVASLGIASAGMVDMSRGAIIRAYNLDFYNVPIRDEIEEYFPGVPVCVINDANAAALAELKKGALRGYENAVLLTLGTGIGGGIILGGKLFNGGLEHGVELGHVTLSLGGLPCTCGNAGCVETLCSATWIISKGRPLGYTDAKSVLDSAREGEPAALEIFNEYTENLSSALASICSLLDPEIIALGGGVSLAGDFLYGPLTEKVEQKSFFKYAYKIVPAQLGNDAGMIGAALAEKTC